ncbi:MAG: peptidoglycan-associated lipoprotein Pal [Rhodoferax sp.]|nr:peptidoglycan-associated lipoprotein Pal [Rhodoferax sp.]
MKKLLMSVSLTLLLAACGSSVKLDTPPVEDKVASPVTPVAPSVPAPTAGSGGQKSVASVDLGSASQSSAMQSANRLVYFDYDSFAIRPEFQSVIESHARFIKADKSKKMAIEGHTDERGGREYNLALGQKRAEAVRRALTLQGADQSQLEAVSFGKEKPAMAGSNEAAWEKNRRAEMVYR